MNFGTKAETLKKLENKIIAAEILPQFTFTVEEWNADRNKCLEESILIGNTLIVRSSSISEDTVKESKAGQYLSIPNVCGKKNLEQAIEQVIASYQSADVQNQVLVQPMLTDIRICGVAFTRDPSTQGDYYVINYDRTGSAQGITSGSTMQQETYLYYCFKNKLYFQDEDIGKIVTCLQELEKICDSNSLDVEFAITNSNKLFVLQVRPLCCIQEESGGKTQEEALECIEKKVDYENRKKPFLLGKKVIYGIMPDWNPAEIIGVRPKPLALSLYREIITDNIWAYQRDNYGYRNLRSFPLLVDFYGLPYIDVRVSFNSFLPKCLPEDLGEKLVNYYLEKLEREPHLHDKVEFQIVFSCYTFDLPERTRILENYGFAKEEIEEINESLKNLTNRIINHDTGLWKSDYEKIYILEKRYEEIMESDLDAFSRIYWLIEDCKRYGTLPFAGLARAGFIAVQMLESMVRTELISKEDYQAFMNEVNTVSTEMKEDFKNLSREAFLKKYGHLRPGTYDITSLRYDEAAELYFDWNKPKDEGKMEAEPAFRLSLKQLKMLHIQMKEHGITDDILGLFDFIKTAIEGREFAKFVFTKSLSEVIRLIGEIGDKYLISKEECAFLNIQSILQLYSSTDNIEEKLGQVIAEGKEHYRLTEKLVLPPLICRKEDIYGFFYPQTQPNFITLKKVAGEAMIISDGGMKPGIEDKILFIESADPGYDWIFSHKILGFVTKFGGANSHMSIRAAELGIPAVIGIGEERYRRMAAGKVLEIDAAGKKIVVLK